MRCRHDLLKALSRVSVSVLIVLFLTVGLCLAQNSVEQLLTKAVEYGAQGQFIEAKQEIEKALKVDPTHINAKLVLGAIEDITTKRIAREAAIHFFKGKSYGKRGELNKAIAEFNKALEINPGFAVAYLSRGIAYGDKGNYDKAISDCNKALEINPYDPIAYLSRGISYESKGRVDQAFTDYNLALGLNPDFAIAYLNRGDAYSHFGQFDDAISDYNKAIELKPKLAPSYVNRGFAYSRKGQYDQAISDYIKVSF